MIADLPIFPLNTVLFPGGVLPLRVFEPRYMDMVRECMKRQAPFGVCLIASTSPNRSEVQRKPGEAALPEEIGCTAEIADWDMQDLGLLHITVRGGLRFRIVAHRIEPNGLIRADVEPIAADAPAVVPGERGECKRLLARIIAELEEEHGAQPPAAPVRPFPIAEPYALDDAGWVANRLCEILSISNQAKQKLMELGDGEQRLAIVDTYLRQRKVF